MGTDEHFAPEHPLHAADLATCKARFDTRAGLSPVVKCSCNGSCGRQPAFGTFRGTAHAISSAFSTPFVRSCPNWPLALPPKERPLEPHARRGARIMRLVKARRQGRSNFLEARLTFMDRVAGSWCEGCSRQPSVNTSRPAFTVPGAGAQ